jgi:hypothetical protein
VAIPVSRSYPSAKPFLRLADLLMSFHFALDPFIYVLLRCRRRPCVQAVLKRVCRSSSLRNAPASDHPSKHTSSEVTGHKPSHLENMLEHCV